MTISEIIKELRTQNNLSQSQLGGLLGVTQQVVAKWEGGLCMPGAASILAVYRVFGLTPNELLGVENLKKDYLKKR